VPKAGSHDTVYAAVNYTLPSDVDTLFLEAGTQAAGNSDAAGDALYAANAGIAQTLLFDVKVVVRGALHHRIAARARPSARSKARPVG
jgi:hypothetical protein